MDNSDLFEELHHQDSKADGFLADHQTFEDLRSYWLTLSDDPTGITDYLDQVQKYVVSSTTSAPEWQHSTVLSSDPAEQVRALKATRQDIVVTGSIALCRFVTSFGATGRASIEVEVVKNSDWPE